MGRGSTVPEFIQILRENPGGVHWKEIARRLNVTRQTVYRLREKAQSLGIWVENHKGYFRLEEGELTFRLTREEVEALRAAVARVDHLTPLAQRALERLAQGQAPRGEKPLIYTPLVDEYPKGLFERAARAIRERRTCRVTYRNARGQVKTYLFDPYVFIARDPHLYLVGANHNSRRAGHNPILDLRLDQILELTLTQDRFPDPRFDVAAYAQSRFRAFAGEGEAQRVRVRFSPEKAGYIRRTRRHPTQRVEDLGDGSVIWEVRVPLSEDLVHFIASYGPHAQVLEPEALRERVVAWARGSLLANGALEAPLSPEGATAFR